MYIFLIQIIKFYLKNCYIINILFYYKTKFCDSILFNQIYNQENLFEDILSKNIFSKKILNYTLKGFNFVEIIFNMLIYKTTL